MERSSRLSEASSGRRGGGITGLGGVTAPWGPRALVALAALGVAALLAPHESASAAGLLIADGGLGGALEVKEHEVRVTINNGVAVTRVHQVFLNTESRPVEALYTFPVPRGASVANFSMWINGKEMVGEVLEKARAREIYNSYKRVRRDPGLLEQVDYRTFEMRIFPIGPKAEQRVEVTYYQELSFDDDVATYVYPLATSTRRDADQRTTGKFALALEAKSEIPIVALESPSHPRDFAVASHSQNFSEASLETRGGDLGRDVVLVFRVARPFTGIDVIASKETSDDGYFMLTLTAGEELAGSVSGMDYVFVVDVSGSMKDDGKLDLSRSSLGAFVKALGADDRFEIVCFNVTAQTLFGALRGKEPATETRALEFLAGREARGGTVLRPAMETAYRYADPSRTLNVIILSDGLTEQQERAQLVQLIQSRPKGARVFSIGVGNDVNRALLEQLADESGGLAAFVSREDSLDRQAQAFRRKLLKPVATDLKIGFAGVPVYDVEPTRLPNLYHGAPVRLHGRYKGSGAVKVDLAAKVGEKDILKSVDLVFPGADATNPQIERMWASKRMDRMLKEADAGGSRAGAIDEIVRLGERYSITSEYTSFIVLENDAEYGRWKIERKNSLRMARDRKAQEELAARLEEIRSKARADLGPAAVATSEAAPGARTLPAAGTSVALAPAPIDSRPRSQNIDFGSGSSGGGGGSSGGGGGGFGGALDPVSAGIALMLAAAGLAATRKRTAMKSEMKTEP